jgi:hypothetical protein
MYLRVCEDEADQQRRKPREPDEPDHLTVGEPVIASNLSKWTDRPQATAALLVK